MTKENKELLYVELSARLPYSVMIEVVDSCIVGNINKHNDVLDCYYLNKVKKEHYSIRPYLFPLSSMTEEDLKSLFSAILNENNIEIEVFPANNVIAVKISMGTVFFSSDTLLDEIGYIGYDWLNAHHYDYRGLIYNGLAIDATGKGIY